MGKKVCQASLKISKNEKQQFNSLIKVLRPRVYITDSSSFKKLVQELTGNGSSSTSSESSPPPLQPKVAENCPLMGAEVQRDLENSFEASVFTEATNNSSDLWYAALMDEEFNQQACNQICLDDRVLEESMENQSLNHLMAYQNLESLLFDAEPNPVYNCYAQFEQEVSIYDYEWSGLI